MIIITTYPEHMDTLSFADLKKGQIPFYILEQTINLTTPLHHHDFVEFSFVIQGRGTETINGKTYEITSGTARFLLPHQIHAIASDPKDPLRLYCCMFDIQVLLESSYDDHLAKSVLRAGDTLPSCTMLYGEAYEEMHRLCKKMRSEYMASHLGKNSAIRAILIEILLLYIRSFPASLLANKPLDTETPSHIDWEIILYINVNFLQSLTLKDLSLKFGVSSSYISRLFKRHLDINFIDYLHTLRIKRATSLLITTNMPIYDISEEAGFESFRTFSRLFKQTSSLTPSEFRKNFKEALPLRDQQSPTITL